MIDNRCNYMIKTAEHKLSTYQCEIIMEPTTICFYFTLFFIESKMILDVSNSEWVTVA